MNFITNFLKNSKRILGTMSFQFTLLHSVIFVISSLLMVGFINFQSQNAISAKIENEIIKEISYLFQLGTYGSVWQLVRTIRIKKNAPNSLIYVLANANGQLIEGNATRFVFEKLQELKWQTMTYDFAKNNNSNNNNQIKPTRQEEQKAKTLTVKIKNAKGQYYYLLVGKDISYVTLLKETNQRLVLLLTITSLFIGVIAGYFVSKSLLKRLDNFNQAIDEIIQGNSKKRILVKGNNDELDKLASKNNEMLDRINTLMIGIRDLSQNIAHDLKIPLTRLKNLALTLKNKDNNNISVKIINETDNLIKTFDALLQISKYEASGTEIEKEPTDPSNIINDIAELYEPITEEKNGTLKILLSPTKKVQLNRELISQALSNILDNAIKYNNPETSETKDKKIQNNNKNKPLELIIILHQYENKIIINITDNGIGIPENDFERVKQRFARVDNPMLPQGSGLGLSLVDTIVKIHGGKFKLSAGPNNKGLSAQIELPEFVENKIKKK